MKCVIIAPLYTGEEKDWLRKEPGDLIIAADGGYDAAVGNGIIPDLVIGDFDSMPISHVKNVETMVLPVKKDDTDTVVCLREGFRRGYRQFIIAGCLGGRVDHTVSNFQCAYNYALKGCSVWLCDEQNRVTLFPPGSYSIPRIDGRRLSVLSFSEKTEGVELTGTEWELHNAVLTNTYPLGCSNEFCGDSAHLSFVSGGLMVVLSRENKPMEE